MKFTLAQARTYRGLKQSEVADKIGVSTSSYIDYEAGRTYMRVDKAYLFAKVVEMNSNDIIFFEDELHLEYS